MALISSFFYYLPALAAGLIVIKNFSLGTRYVPLIKTNAFFSGTAWTISRFWIVTAGCHHTSAACLFWTRFAAQLVPWTQDDGGNVNRELVDHEIGGGVLIHNGNLYLFSPYFSNNITSFENVSKAVISTHQLPSLQCFEFTNEALRGRVSSRYMSFSRFVAQYVTKVVKTSELRCWLKVCFNWTSEEQRLELLQQQLQGINSPASSEDLSHSHFSLRFRFCHEKNVPFSIFW